MKPAPTVNLEGLIAHAGWLRRFARALVNDGDDADDLAQDAMLAAWRHPVEQGGRAWLSRVARNLAVDRYRGRKRRQGREQAVELARDGRVATPEELIGDAQIHRVVAALVAALPAPFRQTLVLRFYEGRSCADIARDVGVPEGTIRWRLKEGLDRVRRSLDERHNHDRSAWVAALGPMVRPSPAESLRRSEQAPLSQTARLALAAVGAMVLSVAVFSLAVRHWPPRPTPSTEQHGSSARETFPPATSGLPVRLNLAKPTVPTTEEARATGPAATEARSLAEALLQAIAENDYDAFVAKGSPFFRAALPTQGFAALSARLGRRLLEGRHVVTLGSLRRAETIDWLFKIEFNDGNDHALVTLTLDGWQVAGFLIDDPTNLPAEK